ncbi:tetratricopeptide repeat protein [Fulvivirga sp. RKSG066]|uniref:tetratricopeptide repeat-containing sensor histidine kinase n=1 Tax=Fulvivirga aurantia TaxID=2529383 RepID=UPI0012BCB247|nr:tetratricopeptide repeat protein [Fulvivirga aurantia]MTI21967.1 tetratricopeptide repeat protein [Fulvivirga aurantia]
MYKIYLSALLIFISASLLGQNYSWVADSLEIYDNKIAVATENKNFKALIEYYKILCEEGQKTLDKSIYERFRSAIKNEAYKEHYVLYAIINDRMGILEFYKENHLAASKCFSVASDYYKKAGHRKDAAGMAMNLGVILERMSEYQKSVDAYKKAMSIFIDSRDTSSVAMCLENIALAYSKSGNFNEAIQFFDRTDSVLSTNTAAESPRWIGFYYNQSSTYEIMGDHEKALQLALKGLVMSESRNDIRQVNDGYNALLRIYSKTGDDINWLKYMRLATNFYKKTDNWYRLGALHNQAGNFYLSKNKIDSASAYVSKSLPMLLQIKDSIGVSKAYLLKGDINTAQEKYGSALEDYQSALKFHEEGAQITESQIYHNLGSTYMQLGDYALSDTYLMRSLAIRKSMGSPDLLKESYLTLSVNMKQQNRYKEAYEYFTLFNQFQDSIFNSTKSKQIAELQTQYETEKKDQAIAALEQESKIATLLADQKSTQIKYSAGLVVLLVILAFVFYRRAQHKQKTNKLLFAKNTEIAQQNIEKETLLKEIHHRVKNNLQVISSLLSMQTRGSKDVKVIDAVRESQSRVKTMALIHEKLYINDSLSRINMTEYMRQLSEFLVQTYHSDKDIDLVIETEDILLDIDTAIPLGLITNELLSNALKYAFQDMKEGTIKLSLRKEEPGKYRLVVSDTGKGLVDDYDIANSKSLGLKLVNTLTRQLQGHLNIISQPGATFSISFKESAMVA